MSTGSRVDGEESSLAQPYKIGDESDYVKPCETDAKSKCKMSNTSEDESEQDIPDGAKNGSG